MKNLMNVFKSLLSNNRIIHKIGIMLKLTAQRNFFQNLTDGSSLLITNC